MRLGLYADLVYRRDGDTLSTDRAFILFVTRLFPRVDEVVVFGRLHPEPGRAPYALPRDGVRFVPLPYYPTFTSIGGLGRSLGGAMRAFGRELSHLDAVWLFGPHPIALAFAAAARRRRKPVFLGVRQDFPEYVRNQLPSRRWAWAVPVANILERAHQTLAQRSPSVVLGEELGRKYAGGGAPVLVTGFSLIQEQDLVSPDVAFARAWDDELRIFSVSRLDAEKNPLLLPEILAAVREREPRWKLTVAGVGPLADAVSRRAAELGVSGPLELVGYVDNGPDLWRLYRESNVFLHVSRTEGLPQVLFEAEAMGLPIVATEVGGVGAALGHGQRGILIPPDDVGAAVEALERLRCEPDLRRELVERGLEHAAQETLEAQLDRVAAFFHANARAR